MKSFRLLFMFILVLLACMFGFVNFSLITQDKSDEGRLYRVEVSRIEQKIADSENYSLDDYKYIKSVEILTPENKDSFYKTNSDYIIREINNEIYRFDYTYTPQSTSLLFTANIIMAISSVIVITIMLFVYFKIIYPFNKLKDLPYELSKGNLTVPLKESRYNYFGKFIWGLDLLRERLEEQKSSELALQKEKKTLILSLSHDIKTPVGIIELYAKALQKGLYTNENKKKEVAQGISDKCSEIKAYVDEIIKASNEDFLNLEVNEEEFYLSSLVKSISDFYRNKLEFLKIDFTIEKYINSIIKGDQDRAVEVIQNIMENAIKYGDGKSISISFSQEEDCSVISISNSGSDISDSELTHIFDSFWRGSNVGSNTGSGLGLYICRQLMFKMGGDIFAENKNNIMTVSIVFANA